MRHDLQTIRGYVNQQLERYRRPEFDHVIDSWPVRLAQGGHADTAKVALNVAEVGYCASQKTYFHGLPLHTIAQRRSGTIPLPAQIWWREGSCHDLESVRAQEISLPHSTLIGDKAFPDPTFQAMLKEATLYARRKKPKGQELTDPEKYYNRLVSRLRQPIESFSNWLIDKTDIQRTSKVRSTKGLMIHCWGKLTFAFYLLVFNP